MVEQKAAWLAAWLVKTSASARDAKMVVQKATQLGPQKVGLTGELTVWLKGSAWVELMAVMLVESWDVL
jgi:hypothetical protein